MHFTFGLVSGYAFRLGLAYCDMTPMRFVSRLCPRSVSYRVPYKSRASLRVYHDERGGEIPATVSYSANSVESAYWVQIWKPKRTEAASRGNKTSKLFGTWPFAGAGLYATKASSVSVYSPV